MPDGGRPEVDTVRDRGGEERHADHDPLAPGVTADEPEHTDDEREQDDVPERVGEVRGDRQGVALGVVERELEQERRADRPDREGDADTVEPDAAVEARDPRANEQQQRDVRRRVEEEVERVGDRRRRLVAVDDVQARSPRL